MMNAIQRNIRSLEPSTWGTNLWQKAKALRPVAWGQYVFSPSDNPSLVLRRIREVADRGIQKAKTADLQVESRGAQINNELNHALLQRGGVVRDGRKAEVGEVADLNDPEVTRAIQLQERVERTDWKDKQLEYQKKLTDKLSAFAALCQMRNYAGIQDANNLKLLGLVKQATEGVNSVSVWQLFSSNYDLSIFQKICAAFFYWVFYQTGLIHNTIDAYLSAFIDKATRDLTTESNDTRTKVFRVLLDNANDFLTKDINATKRYAYGEEEDLLQQVRDRVIEKHFGGSVKNLCKQFSVTVLNEDPQVKILKPFQEIPIMGYVFKAFEWVVNKVIIQQMMKNIILPKSLETAVTKGLEATHPDKLPFTISLTQFFTMQLEKLRFQIESEQSSPPPGMVAGTAELRPTIEQLFLALELEGEYTPLELRKKFEKVDKDGWIDRELLSKIQQGVLDGGNALFAYLNETIQSGELFARLLDLSLAPFGGEPKTEEMLRAEFEEERLKFERTASAVFKTIVRKAVSGVSKAEDAQFFQKAAQAAYTNQTIVASELVKKMEEICEEIERKVATSQEEPTEENSIQTDIVALFQIMQVLDSRKEFQDPLTTKFDGTHRNEIWHHFSHLFEKIESIQAKVLALQDMSDQYPHHAALVSKLRETQAILTTIQDQFRAQPRHLPTPLLQSLRKIVEEMTKSLGADAPLPRRLEQMVQEISDISTNVNNEQNAIDAIYALYPPRNDENDRRSLGLIDQLLDYQRGNHPFGFRPRECLKTIAQFLTHFSSEEKRELERIIGNGTNIQSQWAELSLALQRIYANHLDLKNGHAERLQRSLDQAQKWLNQKMLGYAQIKNEDHRKMRNTVKRISLEMKELKRDVNQLPPQLTQPLSNRILNTLLVASPLTGAIPMLCGYPFSSPVAAITATVAGGAYKWIQPSSGSNKHFAMSTTQKAVLAGAAAIAYWQPEVASVATGAIAGIKAVNFGRSYFANRSFNKAWNIFTGAYSLSLNSRVYKAFTTRTMQALIQS